MPTCSIIPVASALHGERAVAAIVDDLRPALEHAGAEIVSNVHHADPTAPLAVLIVTGGTERAVLAAWLERQQIVRDEPLVVLTHAGHNSLPAALETVARLQQDAVRARIVPVLDRHGAPHPALAEAIEDVRVWHALRVARVGMVGEPSDWLVASAQAAEVVRRRWGPTLVPIDLRSALNGMDSQTEASLAVPVRLGASRMVGTTDADVDAAARFEPVLRGLVDDQHLDAVAVRCFDLLQAAHTSGCVALSSLNDDGIIAGCEGDVASTIGLLWVKLLLGRLGWMANPAMVDPATGVVELAHCTVPRSLVDRYELDTHFESGIGVGINGQLPAGPVTVVRLGGRELDQLWCHDGAALPTAPREGRCRTQLDVQLDPQAVRELLDHPLGNHLITVTGHHGARLHGWWQQLIA